MLNKKLWLKVDNFLLEKNGEVYGFITRLSDENSWTKEFTRQAILEYKRFMYLAATSDQMVSPSKIVDIVWHQHLIFTNSYAEFCKVLGKRIQHIPSTHNREDYPKFKAAQERTFELYTKVFVTKPPKSIWQSDSMEENLALKKTRYTLKDLLIYGVLIVISLTITLISLLRPTLEKINNPEFLTKLFIVVLFLIFFLELYNTTIANSIANKLLTVDFIKKISPSELIYLKKRKIGKVIHVGVYDVINTGGITIKSDHRLGLKQNFWNVNYYDANKERVQILKTLKDISTSERFYPRLYKELIHHPFYKNIQKSMDVLLDTIENSLEFMKLFGLNFILISVVIMISLARLCVGIIRNKPILYISIFTVVLILGSVFYLWRVKRCIISALIKENIRHKDNFQYNTDKWEYLSTMFPVFSPQFSSMVQNSKDNKFNNSCGSCSSCSSCGSSCSSCGGCGGCGD